MTGGESLQTVIQNATEAERMAASEALYRAGANVHRMSLQVDNPAVESAYKDLANRFFQDAWDLVTPDGWVAFGSHADAGAEVEFSTAQDASGNPLYERCISEEETHDPGTTGQTG